MPRGIDGMEIAIYLQEKARKGETVTYKDFERQFHMEPAAAVKRLSLLCGRSVVFLSKDIEGAFDCSRVRSVPLNALASASGQGKGSAWTDYLLDEVKNLRDNTLIMRERIRQLENEVERLGGKKAA